VDLAVWTMMGEAGRQL